MKSIIIVHFLLFVLGDQVHSQTSLSVKCIYADSIKISYFKTKKLDQSLKPVDLERGSMIIEFIEDFNDSIVVTLNDKDVFEGMVKNSTEFMPALMGFTVENINRNRFLKLRIYLVREKRCAEICFKPKYKRLAISKNGNYWQLWNSDYTYRQIE